MGDVLVVLQPAEELGQGAPALLETGVLEGVAAIFGGHVDRRFAVGEVVSGVVVSGAVGTVLSTVAASACAPSAPTEPVRAISRTPTVRRPRGECAE